MPGFNGLVIGLGATCHGQDHSWSVVLSPEGAVSAHLIPHATPEQTREYLLCTQGAVATSLLMRNPDAPEAYLGQEFKWAGVPDYSATITNLTYESGDWYVHEENGTGLLGRAELVWPSEDNPLKILGQKEP